MVEREIMNKHGRLTCVLLLVALSSASSSSGCHEDSSLSSECRLNEKLMLLAVRLWRFIADGAGSFSTRLAICALTKKRDALPCE